MGLRSNQNLSEKIGTRLQYVKGCLLALRNMRNNPLPVLETFIDLHPEKSKTFLHSLIESDSDYPVSFEYEYLYSLNFHSNKTPGPSLPSPEGGIIGRKSIRG
jgi:hypothetical protein